MTHIYREEKKHDLGRASVIFFDPDEKSSFFSNQTKSILFVFYLIDTNTNERLRIEEGLKLKENIVQVYRKQLDARRALLEIDSGLMDVKHECTRNESIVEQ